MVWLAFMHCVLFSLYFVSYQCEGAITSPRDGEKYLFLPGETAKIKWEIDEPVSAVRFRSWSYKISEGVTARSLADIAKNGTTDFEANMFDFAIERPATLVLKNVNQSYNGIYQFSYIASETFSSEVVVSIAKAPIVTINCSSPVTRNEGDNVTCVCRGVGGNPPANVTWYKDGVQIIETKKENNTLTLSNVNGRASGTYTCVARSHTILTDEKSIEIIVYFAVPPTLISFASNPESVEFGESVVITCEAIAVPLPSYTIIHNNTEIVSTQKTYIISHLNYEHVGLYECVATNHLGNSSKIFSLSAAVATRTTNAPITDNLDKEKTASEECNCTGTEWYIVVVSIVSGIIIGLFVAYILLCARRRWLLKNRKPEQNPKPQPTEVDTTYQELDLTRMNTEDNYQSLRVNAASNVAGNDNDSTYTELSKTRDVENNYQSLT